MVYPKNRIRFTVNEAAKACGISRATLLRMEKCGFLTPYQIDPDTGYRYYDADNIAQIGQYLLLQELGLSRQEVSDVFHQRVDMNSFLIAPYTGLNVSPNEFCFEYVVPVAK